MRVWFRSNACTVSVEVVNLYLETELAGFIEVKDTGARYCNFYNKAGIGSNNLVLDSRKIVESFSFGHAPKALAECVHGNLCGGLAVDTELELDTVGAIRVGAGHIVVRRSNEVVILYFCSEVDVICIVQSVGGSGHSLIPVGCVICETVFLVAAGDDGEGSLVDIVDLTVEYGSTLVNGTGSILSGAYSGNAQDRQHHACGEECTSNSFHSSFLP